MGVRSFIAINLDDTLKKEIEKSTAELRTVKCDVKWVTTQNLHVTLKFLGDTLEDLLPEIEEKLFRISLSHVSFRVKLYGAGIFPNKRNPRVIWLDMLDSDRLNKLQVDIEDSMLSIGFTKDNRPFSPHLTIGRIRSLRGTDQLTKMVETLKDKDFGNIEVYKFSLMKSDLKPTGAQYTIIAEFDLKKEEE